MAQKETLVLDASVAVKWFNPGPWRENALAIRERFWEEEVSLIAPALIKYEVVNTLRYNPKFGIEEVKSALRALEDMQLEIYDFNDQQLSDGAISAAYQYGITAYDATYVALAMLRHGLLYTADEELVEKVSRNEIVRHLSSFNTGQKG